MKFGLKQDGLKIINKWSTGIKSVYKYSTTGGVFLGTKNHRIVSKGLKLEVEKAKFIDSLRGTESEKLNLDPQDIIDGLIIGDGGPKHEKIVLYVGENDKDYYLIIIYIRTSVHQ